MAKHEAQTCGIENCEEEATYWVTIGEANLYLCPDHMCEIEGKDEWEGHYTYIDPGSGKIIHEEIGAYACHDECELCNN